VARREAALLWSVSDMVAIPRMLFQSETEKRQREELEVKADERKAQLETSNHT
jgi:hypothetical protein